MKIRCGRDICIREKCPAPECKATECVKVGQSYIAACEQKEAEIKRLKQKYRFRKKELRSQFDKLSDDEKANAIQQQKAYDLESEVIKTKYEDPYPFQSCGHIFEVPDDTPVDTTVYCPFCKGENVITDKKKKAALKAKTGTDLETEDLFN